MGSLRDASVPASEAVVPVIDISSFLRRSDTQSAPDAVDHAARNSGFFQITGHGVPSEMIDTVYGVARALEALPRSVKDALRSPSGHPFRGLMTNYDLSGRVCSEGFTVSRFDGAADAEAAGVPREFSDYFHANVWPPVDGFRDVMTSWLSTMRGLGRSMMRLFAVALGLSMDYFDQLTVLDASTATIRFYPARHSPLAESTSIIFDEHFDGGMLTMLHQRGTYDGLQVRAVSGDWVSVPVHEDAFVVNVGSLMSRWTNGRWPATRHRVVGAADPEGFRYTLPVFFTVAVDTVVSPLPTTIGAEGPAFEPVRVYDWYRTHLKTTYRERKHTRVVTSAEAFVAGLAEDRSSPR